MLSIVYGVSIIDRSLLSILQTPVKTQLGLADTELGLLTGLAFALFYATLAIPIARVADRRSRMHVLVAALALWSVMTIGSGAATSFFMLLLCRMGVGVGEAGSYPPAASILADYFGKAERGTVLGLFGLAVPIGTALGLFIGGWLNDLYGWRAAFLAVGLLGLLVAPVALFTVREPRRGMADTREEALDDAKSASFLQVLRIIWRLRSLRYLIVANMFCTFVYCAYQSWQPPFYHRYFALSTSHIATTLGFLSLASVVGTFGGGMLSDRLGRRDPRWYVWILAAASTLLLPAALFQLTTPSLTASWAAAVIPATLILAFVGPTIATCQTLVLPHMRATTASVSLLLTNLFGLGLGPLFVGATSDLLAPIPRVGHNSLRVAFVAALLFEVVAIWAYFMSGRALPKDLTRDRSLDFSQRGEAR
jgi:MFS family permease